MVSSVVLVVALHVCAFPGWCEAAWWRQSGNGESLPSLPRRTRCLPAHSPAVLPRVNASVQSIETSPSLAHTRGSTQVSSKAIPPLSPIRNFGRSKESSTTSPHAVAPRRTAFCLIPPSRAEAHSDKLPGNAHARSRTIISTRDGSSAPIHPPRAPATPPRRTHAASLAARSQAQERKCAWWPCLHIFQQFELHAGARMRLGFRVLFLLCRV
ncbi:hypothetical protein B0J12DRAFT_682577 [Macrophomina phaseolina]|uniref:Secreted protein n=1 Tax=Macrophomina phaseolina TaxID=35725 RepID=A0ABQ8FVP5_9PEZI|nr:hypothetical protein B0J12DRAFT_682577 [Macrophomina phaseolina]